MGLIINLSKLLVLVAALAILFISCSDKFDIDEATSALGDDNLGNIGDTVYIKQSPNWEGFNNPKDMIVGREPFIYVADTDNDRIVMLDISGRILGEKTIKRPIAITQNYKLDLVVIADFDTVINSQNLTFSAVYLINLFESGHILSDAKLKRLLPQDPNIDPFAFNRTDRFYTGVCSFSDNSIYVSRKGPSNSNPVDRDNSILTLRFLENDSLVIGKVPGLESEGTGIMSANNISSLTSFDNGSIDIIVSLIGNNSFKLQWLEYISNSDFEGYQNKLGAFSSDLMAVNKFGKPEGGTLDNANNIYCKIILEGANGILGHFALRFNMVPNQYSSTTSIA